MKKIEQIMLFIAIIFSVATAKGQDNMIIHLANASDVTIAIHDIQRIMFNGDNMLVKKITGTEQSYLIDNIALITFSNDLSVIQGKPDNIDVNFYLNSAEEIVVKSPYPVTRLVVFDIHGRTVKTANCSHVSVASLSTGVYLLRVETVQGIVNKKFTKNR